MIGTNGRHLATTLSLYRSGQRDPTTRLSPGEFWRATLTPHGPATLRLRWDPSAPDGDVASDAWGDGAEWLSATVPGLTGVHDAPETYDADHPGAHAVVLRAQHNHPHLRLGASATLYHELLPIIIGQRITGGEAVAQWHRLVRELGEPAPGPLEGLCTPPPPAVLAGRPAWWFHPLGIERKRAEALHTVAKHADRLWEWTTLPPSECAAKLALLPGVGPWTIGSALGPALGDPDAFAIGDYHLKNVVSHALAGEARGTDERMVQLLAPYIGQRGRVVRLLQLDGHSAPKYGPRQRILPMRRW
jgi:hypothetical protein